MRHTSEIQPAHYGEHAYNPFHRRYHRDPAGELSRTMNKLRGGMSYTYELRGNLIDKTSGHSRLQTMTMAYDGENCLTEVQTYVQGKLESIRRNQGTAGCTCTSQTAMHHWPASTRPKVIPKTGCTTSTPIRSALRWK